MTTKHTNAADAAAALTGRKETQQRIQMMADRSEIVRALIAMRTSKNMTQAAIASRMQCTQSRISKLEAGTDDSLSIGELRAYLSALKVNMSLLFDDHTEPAAVRIKHLVFAIDGLLKSLGETAKSVVDDQEIIAGINRFYKEVLVNFLIRFDQNYKQLQPIIQINAPQQSASEALQIHSRKAHTHQTKAVRNLAHDA